MQLQSLEIQELECPSDVRDDCTEGQRCLLSMRLLLVFYRSTHLPVRVVLKGPHVLLWALTSQCSRVALPEPSQLSQQVGKQSTHVR